LKSLIVDQVGSRKDRAVRFLRDVLNDENRADEVESEDLQSYADRRHFQIINPRSTYNMANGGNGGNGRTKADLLQQIDELEQENRDLQDALDSIADIAAPPEEGDEEEEDDDDGD
jgi:hypothetical protein